MQKKKKKKRNKEFRILECLFKCTHTFCFQFTVRATDSGRPPRFTDVEVTIFIVRAQLPQFFNLPYSTTVQENALNNSQIYTVTARDQDGQVSHYRDQTWFFIH